MKTELLRELGKKVKLVYIPETAITNKYWNIRYYDDGGVSIHTKFTYKEALDTYLTIRHKIFCDYLHDKRAKIILP